MKSPPDRLDKIRALLHSPVEGERQAAREALARAESASRPPVRGTPEWMAGVREFHRKIDFCVSRMGTPGLTPTEIRTIRNISHYRGDPSSHGADALEAVYRKIVAHGARRSESATPMLR